MTVASIDNTLRALDPPGRESYRREVERLLDEIRGDVAELRRLKTLGVRAVALADRKHDLADARRRLAALVGHGVAAA